MIKTVSRLLAVALVPLALVPSYAGHAEAAPRPPVLTGTVAPTAGGDVAGVKVRLRALTRSGPGGVVATDLTDEAGAFRLVGGSTTASYYVEIMAGEFQHGWAGGYRPRYWQSNLEDADLFKGGATLGTVHPTPAFVRGTMIDAATKKGVRGVKITYTTFGSSSGLSAYSRRNGSFEITGISGGEDGAMKFAGAAVGYENGVWSCAATVVPPALECQPTLGVQVKKIRIEKKKPAPRVAARTQARAVTPRIIRPGQVGKAKAGMTIAQAMATGELDKNVPNPPCGVIRLQPKAPYAFQYVVLTAGGKIVEMAVEKRRPQTRYGLRVGSTAEQVASDYGTALSPAVEAGYGQWARFVKVGTGADRRWIGFLFGEALVEDGPLAPTDPVTLIGVSKGKRPGLMLDGC